MATATNLQSELQKILDGLGDMPGIVGKLGDVVAKLAAALNPLQGAISRLLSLGDADDTVLESASAKSQTLLVAATDRNVVATSRLTAAVDRLTALLTRTALPALPQATPVAGGGGGAGGGAGSAAGMLGRLAATAAVAAAAIGVMVVGINLAEREFNKLQSLVRLFNPSVIQMFQFAMDNLGATIGRAFVPMFQVATGVLREWTAALAPVIAKLTPIIQELGLTVGNIMVSGMRPFAAVLQSLLPTFRMFAEMTVLNVQVLASLAQVFAPVVRGLLLMGRLFYELTGLGTVVRLLTRVMESFSKVFEVVDEAFTIMETVVNSLVDSFVAFIGALFPLQSMMDALAKSVQMVIRNMYVFAIMLAKFLGLDGVVNALLAQVEGKTKRGDTAAQQTQLKTIEQLSKDMALAASMAGGAAGKGAVVNEQQWWNETLKILQQTAENQITLTDVFATGQASVERMLQSIKDEAVSQVGAIIDAISAAVNFLMGGSGNKGASAPPGPAGAGVGGVAPMDIAKALINPLWGGQALAKGMGFQ